MQVTVTFRRFRDRVRGRHVETLYGDLIITLYAVDPDDGSLVALPDYVSLSFPGSETHAVSSQSITRSAGRISTCWAQRLGGDSGRRRSVAGSLRHTVLAWCDYDEEPTEDARYRAYMKRRIEEGW
jgi:hypothetical protein